jgi:hypothetical protein
MKLVVEREWARVNWIQPAHFKSKSWLAFGIYARKTVISRVIINSNTWHDAVDHKWNLLSNYLTTVKLQVRTASDDTDHIPYFFILTLQKALRNITYRSYVSDVTTWSLLQQTTQLYKKTVNTVLKICLKYIYYVSDKNTPLSVA